jgi:hypothetical protein
MFSRKRIVSALAAALSGLALLTVYVRGDEPQKDERHGPMVTLPSKPGTHIEKIKSLGDNQWVNLGAPAADPKWGKARGRSWGAKAMILAPNLRGAFLFGEGVHAYVKPDGHVMDDLWFYDINAHRWVCLYPGMNTKTFTQRVKDKELKLDDHGLLRDQDGQAIPMHTLIHAWGYLAYDSDRKKFTFLGRDGVSTNPEATRYFLGGEKQMEEGLKLLEDQLKGKERSVFSPWYYDVALGRFERSPATGTKPHDTFSQTHYLPAKKKFLVIGSGADGVGSFDPAKNEWSESKPKGPEPKGWDAPGCYDSKRNRIYRNDGDGSKGEGLMAYDIESNTWSHLKPKGDGPGDMNTNGAYYGYDSHLDVVVAIHFTSRGTTPGVFTYNPETNSWAAPLPFPVDGPQFRFAANTCFDPELNAYFCHIAGDSNDNGVVWAYRYKKRETK